MFLTGCGSSEVGMHTSSKNYCAGGFVRELGHFGDTVMWEGWTWLRYSSPVQKQWPMDRLPGSVQLQELGKSQALKWEPERI